ncbi:hypothetical protein BGW38_005950 [Lunasporangiospora selenospora]|uniref:SAP domain-containing protein n=1 Tax=Lunasporangiospora selenospora TaxID=979761 RepID=A0A9P6G017_9FUNG|nr:hypothetical protein BGW38_005950 [Lunasporangiospora selenospora]
MTMDPSQASSEQGRFSGLSRLQLQAACVKAGLDTTANNDELRQLLQEHWEQTHPSNDKKEDAEASESKTESCDIANETAGGTAREASVKHEDDELNASTAETTTAPVATDDSENVDIKVEEDQEMTPVKDEEDSDNVSKVKKEELTKSMTIAQRKRIWEAKTVSSSARSTSTTTSRPASRIPVAGTSSGQKRDRSPDDSDDIKKEEEEQSNSLPIPGTVQKLIGRFAGPSSSGADQNSVDGESKSMSMTPESGSPASKRRRIDAQGTATTTGTGSMIKNTATKKVIKIPVAGSATRTRSPYAIGSTRASAAKTITATTTTTTTSTASTKVTSTAMAMTRSAELRKQLVAASKKTDSTSAAGEVKKPESKPTKAVSAETINRLATPKKVKATSATPEPPTKPTTRSATPVSTKPTPLTTVAVSVPTRPRGPVLSTASRAAQRRNRTKE